MKRIVVSKKDCVKKVNGAIIKWTSNREGKLIVAIDGYAGSGKTTLLERLARINSSILPVHRDDFVFPRAKVRRLFLRSTNRLKFFEQDICNLSKLERLIHTIMCRGQSM